MYTLGRSSPTARFNTMLQNARLARLPYDREAWQNLAFFRGYHYTEWDDITDSLRRIEKRRRDAPRPVANKIQHFVLQEQATALQNKPTVDVLPASPDPSDISIAAVSKAYLDWLADETVANFNEELSIATLWALAGTEAYLKWSWDPRCGHGDIAACSPMDVYGDPLAKSFRRSRWVIHSHFMDVEQVYDIYGIEVQPESMEKADALRTQIQREMGMSPVIQGATVSELWYPPCRRHPDGLFVVWSKNDFLIEPTAYPYKHNKIPFTQIGSVPLPGTPHMTSVVSALRLPQMELNKFHAQMIAVRDAFANPKWAIDTQLEMEEDPDDSPNQILRYNSNGGTLKPEIIQPTMMPPNDAGAWIDNEMMDVAGIHDVSQAQAPGRVDSAKGIEILQEQDSIRTRELLRTIGSSISQGFWQQLQLVKQFGDEQLVFQTYSREGLPETHQMMTTKIDPGMRLRVSMSTGLSASRAAREDQVMNMWAQQIITDPEIVAELLDMPISAVNPNNGWDIQLARNENLDMARGIAITPNSWDNHDIHRREHDSYRKSLDFKMLPNTVKSKFEMHCELHDQLEIQQLGRKLQIQGMAAAVSQGQGFQQPQAPGPLEGDPGAAAPPGAAAANPLAPDSGGSASPPQPQAPGNGGTPPPASGQVPNAAGARPAIDRMDTPQSQAFYIHRTARTL